MTMACTVAVAMTMRMTMPTVILSLRGIILPIVFIVAVAMALSMAIILLLSSILICQIPFEHQRALVFIFRIIQPLWEALQGLLLDIDVKLKNAIFSPIDCNYLA